MTDHTRTGVVHLYNPGSARLECGRPYKDREFSASWPTCKQCAKRVKSFVWLAVADSDGRFRSRTQLNNHWRTAGNVGNVGITTVIWTFAP